MSLVYTAKTKNSVNGGTRNSLYIGGRSDAKSLEKLERYGISHILNVTPSKEASIQAGVPNFFEKRDRFRYKRVSVYDAPTSAPQLLEAADSVVKFISDGLYHGSVLVHCQHGVSRSTTCVLFYLIRKAGMPLKDALQMIQRRRPQAQPIPAFMEILEQYEKKNGDGDHGDRRKRTPQKNQESQFSNDQKRPRVGPYIGPAHPAKTSFEQQRPKMETTTIIGPPLPPVKTVDGSGPSLPPACATNHIGHPIRPTESTEPAGLQHPYDKNEKLIGTVIPRSNEDRSIGSSPSTPKELRSIGPSLPPETTSSTIESCK